MHKLAVFATMAATLSSAATLGVLAARQPDTAQKIDRIWAKSYRVKGEADFKWQSTSETAEKAFAKAIELNPDEASGIKWFKFRERLEGLIRWNELDKAFNEADAAVAADKSALRHVIVVFTYSPFFLGNPSVDELKKIRQRAVDLARTYDAPPQLLERALSAQARIPDRASQ
jgi:hypothetical protein